MNGSAIEKYEMVMLDPDAHLSFTKLNREKGVLDIVRYVITDLLGWTPQEAMSNLNGYIIKEMHLDKFLPYIAITKDVDKMDDFDYLVHMAFPDETNYNPQKRIINTYKKILSGEISKFPKNYFSKVGDGYMRARCILLYAIQNNVPLDNDRNFKLFKMFSDNAEINKTLKEWRVSAACKSLYNGKPLSYLTDTIGESLENEFLCKNFEFNNVFANFEKEYEKEKQKKEKIAKNDTYKG